MSYAYCLQELVTVNMAQTGTTSVVQGAESYLDLAAFQDLVVWSQVTYLAAGGASPLSLRVESAPVQDETLFEALPLVNINTAGTGSALLQVGTQVNKALLSSGLQIARWVRWRLSATTATSLWTVSFRIWVSASAPGMSLDLRSPDTTMQAAAASRPPKDLRNTTTLESGV